MIQFLIFMCISQLFITVMKYLTEATYNEGAYLFTVLEVQSPTSSGPIDLASSESSGWECE
jgi:hypothetical protein